MINSSQTNDLPSIRFYGGIAGALFPFIVFLGGVMAIALSGAPDERGFWPILILSLCLGLLLAKDRKNFCVSVIEGMAQPIVMIMITAWMLASIIGVLMSETGFVEALTWTAGKLHLGGTAFVIASFLIVISNIDTLLRPRMVPKGAYLNPALTMLSVFGGLQLMGLIGIFYGPVIMILLVTSVDVYTNYMTRTDLELPAEGEGLDLQELGFETIEDDENGQADSGGAVALVKGLAARIRHRLGKGEADQE